MRTTRKGHIRNEDEMRILINAQEEDDDPYPGGERATLRTRQGRTRMRQDGQVAPWSKMMMNPSTRRMTIHAKNEDEDSPCQGRANEDK